MSTVLLTDENSPASITERSRVRTRVSARLHARALDRALAAGVSPDASAALSLRAHTLIGAATRADLARSIRRLISRVRHPWHPLVPHVPLCRRKIIRSAQTLEALVRRLESGQPVEARGVAQVRLLLTGDPGALYDHPAADDLDSALQEAMRALEPSL